MGGFLRFLGIGFVYMVALVGWLVLRDVMQSRSTQQANILDSAVRSLWGIPQNQAAPELTFYPAEGPAKMVDIPLNADVKGPTVVIDGQVLSVQIAADGSKFARKRGAPEGVPLSVGSSDLNARLHGDPRRKGLVWFALYDVAFDGAYGYEHRDTRAGEIRIHIALPTSMALYDDLVFEVNGKDHRDALDPKASGFELRVPVQSGDKLAFHVGYKSRGRDEWSYSSSGGGSTTGELLAQDAHGLRCHRLSRPHALAVHPQV